MEIIFLLFVFIIILALSSYSSESTINSNNYGIKPEKSNPANNSHTISTSQSKEISQSITIFKNNHINKVYHVTSINNWQNIQEMGGLYSLAYLQKNNIGVDYISNDLSKKLDLRANTQNFIKLSFREITPMTFKNVKNGKKLILLSIDLVQLIENFNNDDINFCPINSTDNRAKIFNIRNTNELSQLNCDILKSNKVYQKYSDEYKKSQAEILVREFIPLDYITFEHEITTNDL